MNGFASGSENTLHADPERGRQVNKDLTARLALKSSDPRDNVQAGQIVGIPASSLTEAHFFVFQDDSGKLYAEAIRSIEHRSDGVIRARYGPVGHGFRAMNPADRIEVLREVP